jgi:hypothetical protein
VQVLNRSTHLVLHTQYKVGDIFLSSLFSTSVMAKHEFKQAFLFNCTPHAIKIPAEYVFYTISGLLNFPSETGDVLQIQHLDRIVPLPSASPLFIAQAGQLERIYSNLPKLPLFYLPAVSSKSIVKRKRL